MSQAPRPRRPWAPAGAAFAIALAACAALAYLTLSLGLRDDAARTAGDLRAETARLAAAVEAGPAARARAEIQSAPVAARVVGPRGLVRIDGAMPALWNAGAAPFAARAAAWRSGATVGHGFVEETAVLPGGSTLVTRAPLAMAPGGIFGGGWPLLALIVAAALAVAAATWRICARRDGRLRGLADQVDALAGGRQVHFTPGTHGEWGHLESALGRASHRMIELQGAAEVRMEALGAALAPMTLPAAARTPSGGLVRNDALERLVRGLTPADADALEGAVREGLAGTGSSSRRLELSDGRVIEAETWAVPGGRLVTLGERTEQARLEALRRNLTGSAARALRSPLRTIQTRGGELLAQVPADSAGQVRDIVAASDRLERVVGRLLRDAEGSDRPVRTRAVSAQSMAFALGQAQDAKLRERGLRLEQDIADGLPALEVDPVLVHEILAELLDNASAATPRGGIVTFRARPASLGMVELAVVDTGAGIPARERALVLEPFGRGEGAALRPGAGLGLGVARALAERMGGRISIDAGPGGVARVELPAAPSAESVPSADDAGGVLTGVGAATP